VLILNQVIAKSFDKGAFAYAGRAGNTQPHRIAGMGQYPVNYLLGQVLIGGQRTFCQRYGPAQYHPVAGQNPVYILIDVKAFNHPICASEITLNILY
jgi:hypothetical protein